MVWHRAGPEVVTIMEATGRPHVSRVLVSAASQHGATAEIAQAIGQALSEQGLTVAVIPPEDVRSLDGYDAVIIGSAVYMGHWLDPAKELVNRFREALTDRPVWLFSSGPVGKPSSKLAQSMDQDPADLPRILEAIRARDHRRFAGKLDRKHLSLPQRGSLLVFRGLEGDFRDWAQIRQWADGIARQLALASR
jgi:menaquinone-dependent protoporphyrinogen oxidase